VRAKAILDKAIRVTNPPSGTSKEWNQIKLWRREQRATLLARRLAMPRDTRSKHAAAIERYLQGLLARTAPQTIGFYLPFKGEFDARPLVRALLEKGWTAGLPAVVDKKGPLEFRAWQPRIDMVPGVYDIPVPKARNLVTPSMLLVPVVGFDAENYRLGYGGGYYDRTLAAMQPRPTTLGIGFELSRLKTIYPQEHDVPLDVIITEAGVKRR
jgi:5-formyltetrahydrofolate cyclo-ligase